ncbi:phage tail protein [Prodigiosinella aquatilis]|nr:phage tail protein [Prodigiosinella sp. LS101]WJV55692.1 phage tail protein [Prodigiosinella sp. LS101]WJV60053.1 phage tail protein [Pectobacteriaceae bacterium C111]
MSTKYFTLLTNIGAAKLANATALGQRLALTQMAVGDGGGTLPTPDPAQTELVNEMRRAPLNSLTVDANNSNNIIAEQVIPENEGGFWIREIGLYDADDNLIAIANCPETYKPQLQEGSGRIQTVRMILIVSNTEAVTLKIDPAVVLATRSYVNDKFSDATLTGTPTAPTAVSGNSSDQIATTAFVTAATDEVDAVLAKKLDIAELVGIPLPWPQSTAPTGWLKCNGQAFNTALYPKLATMYPSGTLPDLRGEFIRGWDDGRGVDATRELLSTQSGTWIQPNIESNTVATAILMENAENTFNTSELGAVSSVQMNGQNGARARSYIRPRNVAFNYIVRAA